MQKIIKTFVFVFATLTLSFAYSQSKPIEINKQDFLTKVANYEKSPEKWVSLAEKPIIVDFYANWCKPFKMISPILDKLAEKYADKIIVLDHGNILEQGNHQELLKHKGKYYSLYQLQFQKEKLSK